MSKVAVVKPDHLGDLILSTPAIRAAKRHFGEITLFVSDSTRPLARFLFPEIPLGSINFPHLARSNKPLLDLDASASALNNFDLVLWLREDPFISPFAGKIRATQDFASGGHLTHESAIQKRMMLRHVANYSRTDLFSPSPIHWPHHIRNVGLCIGSGFPTNRWPNVYWLQLASALSRAGLNLTLIAGPGELKDVALLAHSFKPGFARTVIGGADFKTFLDELEEVDVVVATDGGSAHICSLVKPVLSIFGSSPWRRYAPFGRANIVVTRDLGCSPCCNFSMEEVNGCMTRECIVGLEPDIVSTILSNGGNAPLPRITVQHGTSHVFEE